MLKKIGQHVQNLTNRNFAIPVSNGTEALYLSLLVNGIGDGDEVIVPNFSWISSASCISMVGATPVFCDIDRETYHLCMDSVRRMVTSKTKAIIFVHLFGSMYDAKELKQFCENHGILIVEDSCQAFGCTLDGVPAGSIGDISTFSFNTNKVISGLTGGGMVLTDDEEVANKLNKLCHHGYGEDFEYLGRNSRMSNVDAEHILKQMDSYCDQWVLRKEATEKYKFNRPTQKRPDGLISNYFRHTIRFDNKADRDRIKDIFGLKVHYDKPMSENSMYQSIKHRKDFCINAQLVSDTIVTLPILNQVKPVDEIYTMLVEKIFEYPDWSVGAHHEKIVEAFYAIARNPE